MPHPAAPSSVRRRRPRVDRTRSHPRGSASADTLSSKGVQELFPRSLLVVGTAALHHRAEVRARGTAHGRQGGPRYRPDLHKLRRAAEPHDAARARTRFRRWPQGRGSPLGAARDRRATRLTAQTAKRLSEFRSSARRPTGGADVRQANAGRTRQPVVACSAGDGPGSTRVGRRSGAPPRAAASVRGSTGIPNPSASRVRWLKMPTTCATSRQSWSLKPSARSRSQSAGVTSWGSSESL